MSAYPVTGELYAAGFRWREEFATAELVAANDGSLVGSPVLDADGLHLDGTTQWAVFDEFRHAHWWAGPFFIAVEFTPDFAATEAVSRTVVATPAGAGKRFYIQRNSGGSLRVFLDNALKLNLAAGAWQPHWREGDRNTLILSAESGVATTLWLNGVQVGTAAATWTFSDPADQLTVGVSTVAGSQPWSGIIRGVRIGKRALTQADVDRLHAGTLTSEIDPSTYTLTLPCDEISTDGDETVTRAAGRAGVSKAVLGVAAAQPTGPDRRTFRFDGFDDVISMGPNDEVQFAGDNDVPFTAAWLFSSRPGAALRSILGIGTTPTSGAWYGAYDPANERLHFRAVDDNAGAYIGRSTAVGSLQHHQRHPVVCTDDGSGLASGLRIYGRDGRIDSADDNSGVYSKRQVTTDELRIGSGGAYDGIQGAAGMLVLISGVAACPMQADMLVSRLSAYQSRVEVFESPIAVPSGFGWSPSFNIYRDGPRTDHDYRSNRPGGGKVRFVSTSGNDANTGVDLANAWRGIDYAISQLVLDPTLLTIMVEAGVYVSTHRWDNTNITHDAAMIAFGGTVIVGDTSSVFPGPWTPTGSGSHFAARASVKNCTDLVERTPEGFGTVMTPVASVAACDALPGSWYTDNVTLWVHMFSGLAPASADELWISLGSIGPTIDSSGIKLYVGPDRYAHDWWEFRLRFNVVDTLVTTMENCRFLYTHSIDGCDIDSTPDVYIRNCEASGCFSDGFNYHTSDRVLEEQVRSYRNGIYGGASSHNGSTQHDGNRIIRVGGDMRHNAGPNIADIDNGQSWCVGVSCRDSVAPDPGQRKGFSHVGDAWLDSCEADGNDAGDLFEGGAGTINVSPTTKYTTSSGTIAPYDP